MLVAAAQCSSVPLDVERNLATCARVATAAAHAGARLLVFPEMFLSGAAFLPEMWEAAPAPGDSAERRLAGVARDTGLHLVVGTAERRDDHLYNTALLVSPDGAVQRYSKLHLFSLDAFLFRPGVGPVVWETALGRIGVGICYDMLFADPWDRYAGAVELVAIPSAWPEFGGAVTAVRGLQVRLPHTPTTGVARAWVTELPRRIGRSVGAPVVYANHCGESDVALLHDQAVARLVWACCSAVHDGDRATLCDGDGEGFALGEVVRDGRRSHLRYRGVARDQLAAGARVVLAGLGAAEWMGRTGGYRWMQLRGRNGVTVSP